MYRLTKSIDYHFIVRVIKNEVSPEEKEFFDSWLSESEANRETFSEIALLWDKIGSAANPPLPDKQKQWDAISNRIHQLDEAKTESKDLLKSIPAAEAELYQLSDYQTGFISGIFKSRILHVAALLIVFISAGLYFIKMDRSPRKTKTDSFISQENKVEIKTRKAEKIAVTLTDGSKVYLNNESRITFLESFNEKSRDVELEGEAYFAVAPNKAKPFTVKCGNVVTVVKGTEFNIRNRGESVNVVVVKGLVETFSPKKEKIFNLTKGDLLSYSDQYGFSQPQKVSIQHYLAWRNNKFSFSKTPLSEVMEEIERFYNLNITFKNDSLKRKTITGLFMSDSLERILSVISLTLDLKIKLSNRNIIIDK